MFLFFKIIGVWFLKTILYRSTVSNIIVLIEIHTAKKIND